VHLYQLQRYAVTQTRFVLICGKLSIVDFLPYFSYVVLQFLYFLTSCGELVSHTLLAQIICTRLVKVPCSVVNFYNEMCLLFSSSVHVPKLSFPALMSFSSITYFM